MEAMDANEKRFRVRTISYFIAAAPTDEPGWSAEISKAAGFLRRAQEALHEGQGESRLRPRTRLAALVH